MADGARTLSLGALNWPIIQKGARGIFEVSEESIAEAVRLYFALANLKTEPTGALSLGALLQNPDEFRDQKVCVIVSGGNVDAALYKKLI
jgi:threonine dehydratase